MGTLLRRQKLTEAQYRRANRVMCLILVVSYLVYIVVEVMNAKAGMNLSVITRCVAYGVSALGSIVVGVVLARKKICMILMAGMYLFSFGVLIFGNGIVVLTMVFPVLVGFMIYLNSVVVGLGWIGALTIGVIKCVEVANDPVLFNYGLLILAGYVVAVVGSMSVIILLINFSKEDRAVIEQEALRRAHVAKTVEEIVATLDMDFNEILHGLNTLNEAMRSADEAVISIADSSENTATAANRQANMTSHIQHRLEHTDQLAADAQETTAELEGVITNGKMLADHLLEQSDLVDQDIAGLSQKMERLGKNVQSVSGITNTIRSISTQTNLLAVNASIEAARAGQAGKGFSVVAGQIRSLSRDTEDSTEQIESIIAELTAITGETQNAIRSSIANIGKQRQQVDEVDKRFTEIQKEIIALRAAIGTMNENVKSVLEANGAIVESIEMLSAASEEVSAGTQICKKTTGVAFDNLGRFSKKVDGAFVQLQNLKETTGA